MRELDISGVPAHHLWDPTLPPAVEVESGDLVSATLKEITDDQLAATSTTADLVTLDLGRLYPLLGPVAVAGAGIGFGAIIVLGMRRIGGYTGDVLGAAGLVGETVGLLVASARW